MNPPLPGTPALSVSTWFNTPAAVTLAGLKGRVVLLYAFQMLCPSCVYRATPVVEKIHRLSRDGDDIAVVGLHTVFEHHDGMGPESLAAYLAEFDVTFPVGIDLHEDGNSVPTTMRSLGLRGTPSIVVLDRQGTVRSHLFGAPDELSLGLQLGRLVAEIRGTGRVATSPASSSKHEDAACDDDGCRVATTDR